MATSESLLLVRPVSSGDEALLRDLFARLDRPTHPLPAQGRVTLAAVDPRDGSFAGVAQYAPGGDGVSDVEFAVADDAESRGVRSMLALALLRRATADRRRQIVAMLLGRGRRAPLAA
jgi:hypothetical protein